MTTGIEVLTMTHAIISLMALGTGLIMCARLILHHPAARWARMFFVLVLATSVSGFVFPVDDLRPTHIIGIVSLVILSLTIRGYYVGHQHGPWKVTFRVGVVVITWLQCVVAVAEAFSRVPVLQSIGATPRSADFIAAQGFLLLGCVVACLLGVRSPAPHRAPSRP